MKKNVERGHSTRQHIIDVATRLFAADAFEGTAIEAVLQESGLSRGALYHHFKGKDDLFLAVLESIEARIAQTIVGATQGIADPVTALQAGCDAWLAIASDQAVRQIVLLDAPSVIGWQRWRELDERYAFGLLKAGVGAASKAARLRPELVDVFAHMLLAALTEAALIIARSERGSAREKASRNGVHELINRLLT